MMWSPAFLLLLAGVVIAGHENGWSSDKEYTFKIKSRTIAVLHSSRDQHTGVLMKGTLVVQPKNSEMLLAKLTKMKYAQVHTKLVGGWDSEIPDHQLKFEEFPMTGKSFEIKINRGVVRDLVVDKDVPTWEVNVLKSIVSQFQIDMHGENKVNSRYHHGPEENQPYATFKTMEDSVSGKCEVLYDISPLPERMATENHEWVPMPELKGDKDLIQIVKSKNYSNCEQRMSYHFNMEEISNYELGNYDKGKFISTSSVSRIIVSGDLNSFTIQSSETTHKVILSSEKRAKEHHGMVASRMHLSLSQVGSVSDRLSTPSDPQSTGNLVYIFNSPFSGPEHRRFGRPSVSSSFKRHTSSEEERNRDRRNRHKESERMKKLRSEEDDTSSSTSHSSTTDSREDGDFWQSKPTMDEAPEIPFFPYFIGNKGNSVQMSGSIDVVKKAKELSTEIGKELKKPNDLLKEETLEKFMILTSLIRTMNSKQIDDVKNHLYESSNQIHNEDKSSSRRNSWVCFRDAISIAGTGPALTNIKKMIETKKIEGVEASQVITAASKSARIPTPEYIEMFFKIVRMPETQKQEFLRETALLSFADLLRHVIVDKRTSHNRYPIHTFGKLYSTKNEETLLREYIPYMIHELKSAIKEGNSPKIQTYTVALGKIAHPKILSIFEPYLERREPSSKYQRLLMVLSLHKLAKTYPKIARSVSYKVYANSAEDHEVRCAAVSIVMRTNPPAEMLKRMAEFTNYDESKHVNSAVKSAIESASELIGSEYRELSKNARSAKGLLKSETYGPQYSRNIFREHFYKDLKVTWQTSFIGSKDTFLPKVFLFSTRSSYGGLRMPVEEAGFLVSSTDDVLSYLEKMLLRRENKRDSGEENSRNEEGSSLSEEIAKKLKIEGDGPMQLEGMLGLDSQLSLMIPFDNHTLDRLSSKMKDISERLKNGHDINISKFLNVEKVLSFPTETGFPFIYSFKTPSLIKLEGKTKLRTEPELSESSRLPTKIENTLEIRAVYSRKVQERIGFVTPFEHKYYIAGKDNNFQVFLPVRIETEINTEKKHVSVKLRPADEQETYKILEVNRLSYTSRHDVLSMKSVLKDQENTRIVRKDDSKRHSQDVSMNREGLSMQIEYDNEESLGEKKSHHQNLVSSIMSTWDEGKTSYSKVSVKVTPTSSKEELIKIRLSYDSKRKSDSERGESDKSGESKDSSIKATAPLPSDQELNSENRRNQFLLEVGKGIESAKSSVLDMSLELSDRRPLRYAITAALSRSNVDEKSRALFYLNRQEDRKVDLEICAGLETKIETSPELGYQELIKSNPTNEVDADIRYGEKCSSGGKIRLQGKSKQSSEFKKFVQESEEAKECEREKKGEKKPTMACRKLMERASTKDETEISFEFDDMASSAKKNSLRLLQWVTNNLKELCEVDTVEPKNANGKKIDIRVKTSEEGNTFATVHAPNMDVRMRNLNLENVIYHFTGPMYSEVSRKEEMENSYSKLNSYCFMGKKFFGTFDSKMFPFELGKCWHVIMTTYPKEDPDKPSHNRPIPSHMKTIVLAREVEGDKKEVRIALGNKDIRLKKLSSGPEVTVDGKKINISKRKSYQEKSSEKDLEGNRKTTLDIFELQDGSVKLISEKNGIEVVFDGSRMKIKAMDRYRDSVRGLCGNYDDESYNDLKTPKNCHLKNLKEFVATWALTDEKCEGPSLENAGKAKRAHCTYDDNRPSNVISYGESGRERSSSTSGHHDEESNKSSRCTTHRTKVIHGDTDTCFSLRPLPACSKGCESSNTKEKNVDLHCVKNSEASEKLAERIRQGANPDLSEKSVTKSMKMSVPVSCKSS